MSSKAEVSKAPIKNQGWLVTFAATGALLALGVLYSWSIVKRGIPDDWGWLDWQKSLPYSVAVVVFSVMMVLGGRLQDRYGPRLVVTIGGILSGLGMIISSQTTSPWVFTFSFGLVLGTGIGFVYASGTPAAVKWFSSKKTGMISGMVVAGFGMGSVWVAPLSKSLMANYGIQNTLLWLGIGMLIVIVGFAQFLKVPPAGFVPAESESDQAVKTVAAPKGADFAPREVVRTWQFYVLWLTFAFGAGAGLMIIGNLATIVGDQAAQPAITALAVSVLALGNGGGRVLAGTLSDKFGRKIVLFASFVLQAILIVLVSRISGGSPMASVPVLLILSALIGANYGANLAVFPAITKDYYGIKNFGMNYGLVYTAWGLGGFMLSLVAGAINDATQTLTYAYLLASALLVVAAIMMAMIKAPQDTAAKAKVAKPEPVSA